MKYIAYCVAFIALASIKDEIVGLAVLTLLSIAGLIFLANAAKRERSE